MTTLTGRQFVAAKAGGETAGNMPVIDYFTIALTHGLIALAAFRMLSRDELDREEPRRKLGQKPGVKTPETGAGTTPAKDR